MSNKLNLKAPIFESDGTVAIKRITDKKDIEFLNSNGFEKVIGIKDYLVKEVLIGLLNSNTTGKPLSTEEQSKRNQIMKVVLVSKAHEIELTPKQLSLLTDLTPNLDNTLVAMQVEAMLEGKPNPLADLVGEVKSDAGSSMNVD